MRRRKLIAVDEGQQIKDWPHGLSQVIPTVAVLEGLAQIPAEIWPSVRWIAWQLPVAYLLWEYASLRTARNRLVEAWNARVRREREKRPPGVLSLPSDSPTSDERIRRWLGEDETPEDAGGQRS